MSQWFCFRTPPQREIRTVHTLRHHGFDVIILMRPELKRAHRRHRVQTVPKRQPMPALRPYVFIDMGRNDAWARLHVVPVEVRAVGINGRPPVPLSEAGVKYIKQSNRDVFHDTDWSHYEALPTVEDDLDPIDYANGDRVLIQEGPFRGFEGKVINISGRNATALLPLFSGEVPVTVNVSAAVRAA